MSNIANGSLAAFEKWVQAHPTYGLSPKTFLRKLEAHDDENPEFIFKHVDNEWQMFRAGWIAARVTQG